MAHQDDVEFVVRLKQITQEAAAAIDRIYRDCSDAEIQHKGDGSPLTAADLAANEIICQHLRADFPEIPIVSEEDAQHLTPPPSRFFLVDPLDGTKEFISRNGDFTVNIALIEDGQACFGVIALPAHQQLFWSDSGQAFMQTGNEAVTEIRTRTTDTQKIKAIISHSHLDKKTEQFLRELPSYENVPKGSSLKLCHLAMGEADIYPRFGRTMEWDIAAGHAILSAAGGILRHSNHQPFAYGKKDYANDDGFIAYGDPAYANTLKTQ